MNKAVMYSAIRSTLFGGKLRQGVVNTLETILAECEKRQVYDYRHIAYIAGTAYHEAYNTKHNPDWFPVREGFASSNQGAITHVTKLYNNGKIKKNYAIADHRGKSYYGRGWVQVTHLDNYTRLGDYYGIDLLNNPDLALQRPVAATLLVDGMKKGWYTGKKLADFITDQNTDFIGARRVINGTDKAKEIAAIAEKFYYAMVQL